MRRRVSECGGKISETQAGSAGRRWRTNGEDGFSELGGGHIVARQSRVAVIDIGQKVALLL